MQKIQRENQAVWQASSKLHEKYQEQQDTINKILDFLASVYSKKKSVGHKKRKLLLENDTAASADKLVELLQEEDGDEPLVHKGHHEFIPLAQDLDILDDRVNSLSFLMGLDNQGVNVGELGEQDHQALMNLMDPNALNQSLDSLDSNVIHGFDVDPSAIQGLEGLDGNVIQGFDALDSNAIQGFDALNGNTLQGLDALDSNEIQGFDSNAIQSSSIQRLDSIDSKIQPPLSNLNLDSNASLEKMEDEILDLNQDDLKASDLDEFFNT